jgi:hypothetical protein
MAKSRTKRPRLSTRTVYRQKLLKAISGLIPAEVVKGVAPKAPCWVGWRVMLMALLMAWDGGGSLGEKFEDAWLVLRELFPRTRLGGTYQGFIKALLANSYPLLDKVSEHLRAIQPTLAGDHWLADGWCPFAADGSRSECPRTRANQRKLKRAGRKKTGPQLFVTTVYHLGSGLPWCYRIGPGTDSERNHLRSMLPLLPAGSLLIADAGFVGYELLTEILGLGLHFLIRAGSNVSLLKGLGYGRAWDAEVMHLWPDKQARQGKPPLALRLITLHDGRKPIYLLSDLLDPGQLSGQQARSLYRRRWAIEVFYRSLKQTLGHRKMRSGAPQQAENELAWAVMGLWLLSALTVKELVAKGRNPLRMSVAAAIKVIRQAMALRPPAGRMGSLRRRLADAVKDGYVRKARKAARDWPRKKNEKPAGKPKIRVANREELQRAKELAKNSAAA